MTTIRRLLQLVAPFRWWIALAILLNFATLGAGVGLMAMAAYLIAKAALVTSVADLALATVAVRFFAISRAALRYTERSVTHSVAFRILARLRTWFYRSIEPLAPARLQSYHSGDLFARIGADVETLQDFYVRVVVPPIAALLTVLLASLILGSFSPMLGVALLIFLLLTGVALPLATRWLSRSHATTITQVRAQLHAATLDALAGDADLLAAGAAQTQLETIDELSQQLQRAQLHMAKIRGLGLAIGVLLTGLASITVLGMAIPLVDGGQIAGEFLALLPLTAIASFEAVQPLALAVQQLETSKAAGQRLFELIDAEPEVAPPTQPAALPTTFDLKVRNLYFAYAAEEPPIFEHISFTVPAGEKLAVVGPSGAGKSTLANLLLRFWEYEGSITIGGVELRTLDPDAARSLFSVVAQQTYLFNSTIRDNLLLAQPEASDAELLDVCRAAQLGELLERLPDGLHTLIGEDGMRLSGGERQRLALARAMLKDAPILILDEPTASLDPLTEARVSEALAQFATGRTTLVLTHAAAGPVLQLAHR